MIPREYGAWAMLLMSLALPLGVAGVNLPGLLFLLAAIALFLARFPLELMARGRSQLGMRRWFLLYALLGLLLIGGLLLLYHRWLLLPLGLLFLLLLALHLYLIRRRWERTVAGELLLIAGLSFSAAGGHYAILGQWQKLALVLWLLSFLYLGASVFYVRTMVRRPAQSRLPLRRSLAQGRELLLYLLLVAVVLVGLFGTAQIPSLALLAYLPLLLKTVLGVGMMRGKASIRVLGFMEIGYSALFAFLLIVGYRWAAG